MVLHINIHESHGCIRFCFVFLKISNSLNAFFFPGTRPPGDRRHPSRRAASPRGRDAEEDEAAATGDALDRSAGAGSPSKRSRQAARRKERREQEREKANRKQGSVSVGWGRRVGACWGVLGGGGCFGQPRRTPGGKKKTQFSGFFVRLFSPVLVRFLLGRIFHLEEFCIWDPVFFKRTKFFGGLFVIALFIT